MSSVITGTVTPASVADNARYLPWLTCFCAALFFFFEFMQVNIFNAIAPSLMKEFSLSAARVGHISANYFYATLIFLIPAGMILDRVSTRKVILVAMSSSVLCTYVFATMNQIWIAELSRFITGLGGSFCLISCIRLAANWFPPRRLALVIGLIVTLAMFGGMLAQTPMTLLTDMLGWRKMMLINASVGVLILVLIMLFVKDGPTEGNVAAHTNLAGKAFIKAFGRSLANLQNWLAGLYTSLLNLPIFLLGALWGGLYLVQIQGLSRTQASFVTSMIFFGTIIGSPLIGWCSDRIGKRRLPMIICASLSLASILIVMFTPSLSLLSLLLLFFAIGFFTSGQIISYPLIAESNPKALIGTSEGIASTLIMAGGTLQPLFGTLVSFNWQHRYLNGVPLYSKNDFMLAMSMIPVAFVIGLIAAFFIRETYCKPLDNV
ncbi:MAG: MFS transporter [Gammaproteobacteria bacterium]|nr:MFS transporter [Gammaproteobacteria bacterium]